MAQATKDTVTKAATSDTETRLRATEQRYQAFIHNSLEGIWRYELEKPIPTSLSPDEQIDMMFKYAYLAESNDAMAKMYGLKKAAQLIGGRLGDLLDRDIPQNIEYLKAFIASGYNLQGMESAEPDVRGNTKYFLNSLVGIIEDGAVQRAWGTQLDVTQQHQTTAALQRSQERLGLALKVSRLGMWEWDVATGELSWSDELRKIYKVPSKTPITYELYISRIHPKDRERMQEVIQGSMKSGKPYEVEHRIVWPDGSIHWVFSRGQALLDKTEETGNAKPVRMTGSCLNIDERKSAEQLKVKNALLSAERKELVRRSKSKDDFIALASHQLRTPATSVKQYLGMLLEGFAGELKLTDTQMDMLRTANESNERQIAIINDLLLIATIDAGKIKLRTKPTDIGELMEHIVEEHAHNYAAKDQTIRLDRPKGTAEAAIDEEKFRMAIENLLDNASKYSPERSETVVSVTKAAEANGAVAIAIKDQGVGIDKADFAKLFQKFSRIHNELSTSAGGSGLGLYWAHKVIELHGGTLSVDSAPGKGSTFTVTLPV